MEFRDLKDYIHLKSVARKLWESRPYGNVALMVGAGFSRNAIHRSDEKQKMAAWGEVVDRMLEELHPSNNSIPNWDRAQFHARATHVAQLYETQFGEANLFNLIRDLLRDNDYIPGKLHHDLFELPWKDIFTTNYDTLLERASGVALRQNYKVIHAIHDLVGKKSPRIVKLNGSFPSHTPFIITEEHFRTYPIEFAPFVNTVLQSMIESTLVLIGFSGDDPNFQNWTGWIRDNLGASRPNIYVVTGNTFSHSDLRLLEKRQIIPIDLTSLIKNEKQGERHEECLRLFFQFLKESEPPRIEQIWGNEWRLEEFRKKKNAIELELPHKVAGPIPSFRISNRDPIPSKRDEFQNLIQSLEHNRGLYPGWIICPIDIQKSYFEIVLKWEWEFEHHYSDLDPTDQIRLAYEVLWIVRHTHSTAELRLLGTAIYPTIRRIISSYNPFPNQITPWLITDTPVPSINLDPRTKSKWVELVLDVPWDADHFNAWMERIEPIVIYDKIWKRKWLFEKAISEKHSLRFKNAIKFVQELDDNIIDAEWMLRIGFLWSDLGNSNRAEELFTEGLSQVRLSLALQPENPRLQSLDSILTKFVGMVRGVEPETFFNSSLNERNNSWNVLVQMELAIKGNAPIVRKDKVQEKSFDLNWTSMKGKRGYTFKHGDFLPSQRYIGLFLFEGFPFILYLRRGDFEGLTRRLFQPAVLNWISISYPDIILSLLSASSDLKKCKAILSRGLVDQLNGDFIDHIIQINLDFLDEVIRSETNVIGNEYPDWFGLTLISRIERAFLIVARLTPRIKEDRLAFLVELAKKIHTEAVLRRYPELKDGLRSLFENLTLLHIENGRIDALGSWLLQTPSPYYLDQYLHSILHIDVAKDLISMLYQFEVQVNEECLSKYINSLVSEARSKDEKIENGALDRLFQLIALGYLPPRFEQRCSKVLRRKVPEDLAEKHFHYINEIMKYVDDSTKLVEFTRGKLLSAVTTNPNMTEMGNYALMKYNSTFQKLFFITELGSKDSKPLLLLEKSSFSDYLELLPKYISGSNVVTRLEEQEYSETRILCEMQTWLFQMIIYYRKEWDENDISNIKKSIDKLEEANIPTVLLLIGLWNVDPKTTDLKKCSSLILSGLFSSRYYEVISAIDAIRFWWKLGNLNIMEPAGEEIISALLRKIESKNDPGLANAILVLIDLIISEPKDFITEDLKPQINFALEILYAELGPLNSITDFWEKIYRSPYEFDENQFPHLRYLASRFAFYYGKLFSRANEPSIINLWRQLSVNDNLPEIRAMWRDDR